MRVDPPPEKTPHLLCCCQLLLPDHHLQRLVAAGPAAQQGLKVRTGGCQHHTCRVNKGSADSGVCEVSLGAGWLWL